MIDHDALKKRENTAAMAVYQAHNQGWLEGYAEAKREVAELALGGVELEEALSDWIHGR